MIRISNCREVIIVGVTKQRRMILAVISSSHEHLSADQVFEKVKQVYPGIARGTIYRNLNLLADEGVIKRLQLPNEPIRFDCSIKPHQHTVCVVCGIIADTDDIEPAELIRLAGPDTKIVAHSLLIHVVCEDCSIISPT